MGVWWSSGQQVIIFNRMLMTTFTEKGRLEQRLEGGERMSQVDIWGKSIVGRGNS